MPRPRNGRFATVNRKHGIIFLSRDVLEDILEIAELEGYRLPHIYVEGEVQQGEILLWVSPWKTLYNRKLHIAGPRKTVFFHSRRLADAAGNGRRPCRIQH